MGGLLVHRRSRLCQLLQVSGLLSASAHACTAGLMLGKREILSDSNDSASLFQLGLVAEQDFRDPRKESWKHRVPHFVFRWVQEVALFASGKWVAILTRLS